MDWTLPRSQLQEDVRRVVACTRQSLGQALHSIKTRRPGELSIQELKTLHDRGISRVSGIDTESDWAFLAGVVSLIHPQGRSALPFDKIMTVLSWVESRSSWWVKYFQAGAHEGVFEPSDAQYLEELLAFVEPQGALGRHALTSIFRTSPFSTVFGPRARDWLTRGVEVLWSLFESVEGKSRDSLTGIEIKKTLVPWLRSFLETWSRARTGQEAITFFQDVREQPEQTLALRALIASGISLLGRSLAGDMTWPGAAALWFEREQRDPWVSLALGAFDLVSDPRAGRRFLEFQEKRIFDACASSPSQDSLNFREMDCALDLLKISSPPLPESLRSIVGPLAKALVSEVGLAGLTSAFLEDLARKGPIALAEHRDGFASILSWVPGTQDLDIQNPLAELPELSRRVGAFCSGAGEARLDVLEMLRWPRLPPGIEDLGIGFFRLIPDLRQATNRLSSAAAASLCQAALGVSESFESAFEKGAREFLKYPHASGLLKALSLSPAEFLGWVTQVPEIAASLSSLQPLIRYRRGALLKGSP